MKSTSPSWSCCTTSRSWPSVPLGKTRTVTAPLVAASASSLKVSPKTCSDVVPAAIECDRRRTRRPPSVRERQPAASAAAPTPERNARRPMTWVTQAGLCRSPRTALVGDDAGGVRRHRFFTIRKDRRVRRVPSSRLPCPRPMDLPHATLRRSRDRRDCRWPSCLARQPCRGPLINQRLRRPVLSAPGPSTGHSARRQAASPCPTTAGGARTRWRTWPGGGGGGGMGGGRRGGMGGGGMGGPGGGAGGGAKGTWRRVAR